MAATTLPFITKSVLQQKYPDVYEYCCLQCSISDAKFDEKKRVWEQNGITCFERWSVPYFLEREREKKRPCLRLNYPADGKCADCAKSVCRYDKMCFICGGEGHGAFQTFPGGKLKGELKCTKYRTYLQQLSAIKSMFPTVEESDLISLFKTGGPSRVPVSDPVPAPKPPVGAAPTSTGANGLPGRPSPVVTGQAPSANSISMLPVDSSKQQVVWTSPPQGGNAALGPQAVPLVPGLPPSMPPGMIISGISGQPPIASGVGGSISKGAIAGPPSQIYTFEVDDEDELAGIPVLKFSMTPNNLLKVDASGTMHYKGTYNTGREWPGDVDVSIKIWRKGSTGSSDLATISEEMKALRVLGGIGVNVARVMHPGILDVVYPPMSGTEFQCVVTEYSNIGFLDKYMQTYLTENPRGFPLSDIQLMTLQLTDALMRCHHNGFYHKDIKPQNILVCRGNSYDPGLLSNGLILKITDFGSNPTTFQSQDSFGFLGRMSAEKDGFAAPESDSGDSRFHSASDIWSLGCVIFYIATGGQMLFDSIRQAKDATVDDNLRKSCLEKFGIQDRLPMIHDLVERMVRKVQVRAPWQECRCHPFLWSTSTRKRFLIEFADASNFTGPIKESVDLFTASLEQYGVYVFDKAGWASKMNPDLLEYVQPPSLKEDSWWSAPSLLQAIRNQLVFPSALHAGRYPQLSSKEVTVVYLRTIVDSNFPKLLILLYELGRHFGKWSWDGRSIRHDWNVGGQQMK